MKKIIICSALMAMSLPSFAQLWLGCKFTKLQVADDGTWSSEFLVNNATSDTLKLVSGKDTAMFILKHSEVSGPNMISNGAVLTGTANGTMLKFPWGSDTYSAGPINLNPKIDSLELIPIGQNVSSYIGDKLTYGGTNSLLSLGNGLVLYQDNHITETCEKYGPTYKLVVADTATYLPYMLRGIVYDQNGNVASSETFFRIFSSTSDGFASLDECTTSADGSYLMEVEYLFACMNVLYHQPFNGLPVAVPIQPITLGKPFGDTVDVDIHLLGPLADGETVTDAITVQRSGSILHVSGAVRDIVLIDAAGRSMSRTSGADVDIEMLPAGVYYLSVQMADGLMVRHPFSK